MDFDQPILRYGDMIDICADYLSDENWTAESLAPSYGLNPNMIKGVLEEFGIEVMGFEEFKEKLTKNWLWHSSLALVNKRYRKIVADTVYAVHNSESGCGEDVAKTSANVVKSLASIDWRYVNMVFKDAANIAEKFAHLSCLLLGSSPDILKIANKEQYKTILSSAHKLLDQNLIYNFAGGLIELSPSILEKISDVDKKYIPVVFEAADKLADKDVWLTWKLVGIETDDYTHDNWRDWDEFNYQGKDLCFGLGDSLTQRLKKLNGADVDADYFLIEVIQDQKDAQVISQLIDMDKYKDQYNEKVAGFY